MLLINPPNGNEHLMVTGSPQIDFFCLPPPLYGDFPHYGYGDCVFGHRLFSHAFAEASQFSRAHRANIPHHHTAIAVAVAFAAAVVVSHSTAGCRILILSTAPRFHVGITIWKRGLTRPHFHTGTIQSPTHFHKVFVTIWEFRKKSPYENN
jgi:hypothetical protein